MALRNEHQIIDGENVIPSRDPELAEARLEREITNGVIRDTVDLRAALASWEYRRIPTDAHTRLQTRLSEQEPPMSP